MVWEPVEVDFQNEDPAISKLKANYNHMVDMITFFNEAYQLFYSWIKEHGEDPEKLLATLEKED